MIGHPGCYHDPQLFQREQAQVFARHWHFAAFADQLDEPDDFVTLSLGRWPVIVRNTAGELRAFLNVCSHRHALLRPESCGRGPLRCTYHGWTYDAAGVPVGIPGNRENFGFDDAQKRLLALRPFPVERCGQFVFVRGAFEGPSLRDYLGAYVPFLEGISAAFTDRFETRSLRWQCNWKIGVENAIENYHVGLVHDQTLGPALSPPWRTGVMDHAGTFHAAAVAPRSLAYWDYAIQRLQMIPARLATGEFAHYIIYPNMLIGLTHGALMSFQVLEPVGPGQLLLRYALFLCRSEAIPDPDPEFRNSIRTAMRGVTDQLLEEDQAVVELVQRGTGDARGFTRYGTGEERIRLFHEWLAGEIGEGACAETQARPSDGRNA